MIGGTVAVIAGGALGLMPGSVGDTDRGSVLSPAYNLEPSFGDWLFGAPVRDARVESHDGLRAPMLVRVFVDAAATVVTSTVRAPGAHRSDDPQTGDPVMSSVSYASSDGVARIRLCDGDRGNPMDQGTAGELGRAVRRARADDVHLVVLSAEGRAFSFGGDVSAFAAAEDTEQMVDDLAESLHRVVSDLHRMDAIVLSVVHGTAAGAGLSLAAAADLVIAGSSAKFTLAYTKIGFSPDGGSSLLTASAGLHRALHLALLNPVLSAEQARELGLVAQVHPDDELESAVDDVVALLRSGSRTAQVATKRLLRENATPGAEAALRRETLSVRERAAAPDGREGVAAFLEKRSPRFPSTDSSTDGL